MSNLDDYKPNSNKFKEEQKETALEQRKAQKVVTGQVKTKKKSEIKKFTDIFVSEDATKVKDYIVMDVIVPSIKKLISEMVTNGIDMILYGETGRTKKSSVAATKTSYRSYYEGRDSRRESRAPISRSTYSYDDVILETRGEAEAVLQQMDEIIANYDVISVADFYDLVGITGSYTDNKYGWDDLRAARVERTRDGYVIRLPRTIPLN